MIDASAQCTNDLCIGRFCDRKAERHANAFDDDDDDDDDDDRLLR